MPGTKHIQTLLVPALLLALALSPQLAMLQKVAAAANYNIAIQNESFNPSGITVHTSDVVIWKNNDPLLYELYLQYASGTPITVSPVLQPGDTYTQSFNTCALIQYMTINSPVTVNGTIRVLVQGDVNGNGQVDITDLVLVGSTFGQTVGSSRYNPAADLNQDGTIDIVDLVLVASNFGRTCT